MTSGGGSETRGARGPLWSGPNLALARPPLQSHIRSLQDTIAELETFKQDKERLETELARMRGDFEALKLEKMAQVRQTATHARWPGSAGSAAAVTIARSHFDLRACVWNASTSSRA